MLNSSFKVRQTNSSNSGSQKQGGFALMNALLRADTDTGIITGYSFGNFKEL